MSKKIQFALRSANGHRFRAEGIDLPIVIEAATFKELRTKVDDALRDQFEGACEVSFLIGGPDTTRATNLLYITVESRRSRSPEA